MKTAKRRLTLGLALCMGAISITPLAACGGGGVPDDAKDRTVVNYHYGYDDDTRTAYADAIAKYNSTQGAIDKVWVTARAYSGETDNNLDSVLANKRKKCSYNIIQVNDNQFKDFASKGYLLSIEDYLTDDVKAAMKYDKIPENQLNRFKLNSEKVTSDKNDDGYYYLAGDGADQVGLPVQNSAHVLYYSVKAMETAGVNIISCTENELATKYPGLQPHGYAEYLADASHPAPYDGAKSSTNEAGDTVYKVFNNKIPMNWEENRLVARLLMNNGGLTESKKYGYCSEWWFNYGWSIGGDCIGWDYDLDEYEFTLCDTSDNWLATDTIEVKGNKYYAGDVVLHEDAAVINGDAALKTELGSKIHRLPSQYDAILEFVRLSQGTNSLSAGERGTASAVYGYGIGQDPNDNRSAAFLSGKNTPMVCESTAEAISFSTSSLKWDMAPTCQWREYKGGSTYMSDGTANNHAQGGFAKEYLKVIGKDYGDGEYTGELDKAENGTPFVGRATSATKSFAMCIPENSDTAVYEASVKFMAWMAGPEGQKVLIECNKSLPNQPEIGMADSFTGSAARLCDNYWAASFAMQKGDLGDYDYFQSQTWINNWSDYFNQTVRKGGNTLDGFIDYVADNSGGRTIKQIANANLAAMDIYMRGR